jgi:hypothetical protein
MKFFNSRMLPEPSGAMSFSLSGRVQPGALRSPFVNRF